MPTALTEQQTRDIVARLADAHRQFAAAYPGESGDRQPVHTVYGGAHLFKSDIAARMGASALRVLEEHAPDAGTLARALGLTHLDGDASHDLYRRVVDKLAHEPVEDYRIDFEDGYGTRPDAEEDGHAEAAAEEMANGLSAHTLPPFVGIRIKPLNAELQLRSIRTLDLFLTTLLARTQRVLPPHFVVTLPKVTSPEPVGALVDLLEQLERANGLMPRSLRLELMIETPQSIFGARGELMVPALVAASRGRCRGAHFGTYDYTAGLSITAMHQVPSHPACDFARHVMQVCLAGTGVTISDGATTVMPVGPHRPSADGTPLSETQRQQNLHAVHRGWRVHFDDVRMSLRNGFYQGWDLNPGQLPSRYAAVFSFYLEAQQEAAARLKAFVEKAAQATLLGSIFDDAATGQGLLNFFLRGINCGALTEDDALATGLTLAELRGRSFVKILNARRAV